MLEYDQSEFFLDVPEAISMDSIGYVYVPTACKNKTRGETCETFSFKGLFVLSGLQCVICISRSTGVSKEGKWSIGRC